MTRRRARARASARPIDDANVESVRVPYLDADGYESSTVSRRRGRPADYDEDTRRDAHDERPPGWARPGGH